MAKSASNPWWKLGLLSNTMFLASQESPPQAGPLSIQPNSKATWQTDLKTDRHPVSSIARVRIWCIQCSQITPSNRLGLTQLQRTNRTATDIHSALACSMSHGNYSNIHANLLPIYHNVTMTRLQQHNALGASSHLRVIYTSAQILDNKHSTNTSKVLWWSSGSLVVLQLMKSKLSIHSK